MKKVAIFDLDGTILSDDCEYIWADFIVRHGIMNATFLHMIQKYLEEYHNGTINYVEYEKFLIHPIRKLTEKKKNELITEYLEEIRSLQRDSILSIIENHRQNDYRILLATSTNQMLAEPIGNMIGINDIICTKLDMKDGVPTGDLLGKPAFNEEKKNLILNWIGQGNYSMIDSWGYSDSHNDLPMLKLVQNPVAVTPDNELRKIAIENGWRIIDINV